MRPLFRRASIALLALAFVPALLAAQGSRVRIAVAGHPAPVLVDSMSSSYDIKAPARATFDAATKALAQLGATIDTRDTTRLYVGMTNLPRMRTFAGRPLSRIVGCGNSMMGPNADNWRVFLTTYAFVDRVDSTTSRLRLAVVAGARDVAGTSTAPVACSTTGVFEGIVKERVERLLKESTP